jgi:ABC-type microcin C transport system duplicated ATPase subunit YejF
MEIISDSFLKFPGQASSRIQVRYLGTEGDCGDHGENGARLTSDEQGKNHRRASLVVIRQPYSALAPAIRSLFEGDEDVRVIEDRRKADRRRQSVRVAIERRTGMEDRRQSFPILDVIIDLDA